MSIPLSRVKSLCTQTELALVQASRAPQLNRLSLPEARELATRARRMFDKAQGQGRQQGRKQAKRGVGQPGTATAIKEQIFRDALDALERQVQKLQESGATATAAPPAKKLKSQRTVQHRANRAAVRKGLSDLTEDLAERAAVRRPQPAPAATSTVAPQAPAPAVAEAASAPAVRPPAKKPAAGKRPSKRGLGAPASGRAADARRQLKANTAAKKTRISMSGLTTRVRGHVSARGKRSQARRDKR